MSRQDQTFRELRELVLILVLAVIGIGASFGNLLVVGVFIAVIVSSLLLVRGRLRAQLGAKGIRQQNNPAP